ncbi:MAG: nitrite reductase, partial [Bacteroidota bacterium]
LNALEESDYFDWGQDALYKQEIGVGECAGVILDLIGAIINDALQKIDVATDILLSGGHPTDALYNAYSANVIGAKALLLSEDIKCNTQIKILSDFNEHFIESGKFLFDGDFQSFVLSIKKEKASIAFAKYYLKETKHFLEKVIKYREHEKEHKQVIGNYYKA